MDIKEPAAGKFGKSVVGSTSTASDAYINLTTLPITSSVDTRYLIANTALDSRADAAGRGCVYGLFINGNEITSAVQQSNNTNFQTTANIITIETIPAGSAVPVEIRFRRLTAFDLCISDNGVFSVVPLE